MVEKKERFTCATDIKTIAEFDCYFDLLGNLVIVLDKKANILLFNSGAEKMLGYKAKEILGENWMNIFVPKDVRSQITKVFNDMMAGKQEFLEEYTNAIINKKGESLTLRWHSSVIKKESGETQGLLASATDVSGFVNLESDLKEKMVQSEKINQLMIGRELKMVEQKEEIKKLKQKLAEDEKKK